METTSFYSEDILIEKMQDGEYGWPDYVNHHSHEWQEEYAAYCEQHSLPANDASAEQFVHHKDAQLEAALESGDA